MAEKQLIAPLRIDFAGGWIDLPDFHKLVPGYVVNAAVTPHITKENGHVDFSPYKPGGGVSSSTGALILDSLRLMTKYSSNGLIYSTPQELAETIFRWENHMINFKIGRQDQYAIALGGINSFRFGYDGIHVSEFEVESHLTERTKKVKALEERLLLVHSGIKRPAQGIVQIVRANVASGQTQYIDALKALSKCGERATKAVRTEEFEELAYIMSQNWEAQKQLVPQCTSEHIDKVHARLLKNGALGGKMCGCGGGGYFAFYCHDKPKAIAEARKMKLQVINPTFEMKDVLTLNHLNYDGNGNTQ